MDPELTAPAATAKEPASSWVYMLVKMTDKEPQSGPEGSDPRPAGDEWQPFLATFEHAPIGLAHVALDGTWLRVNQRLCEIVGYSPREMANLTFQDITHPDDLESDLERVRAMLAGEIDRYDMEKRYIRKDRAVVWANLTVALLREPATGEPLYFISAVEDIDSRKRAEEAHRETENRFHALVEGVKEYALFMTDISGIIQSWNPGVRRVLGWEEDEIVGQHIRVIFTPEDRGAGIPEREMETAARTGSASDERWHIKKDGSRFYAIGVVQPVQDEHRRLIGFSKVLGDFTDRYNQIQQLAQQAALIDLSFDAIFVQDEATNTIVFWSEGARRTYGYSAAEALGRPAYELLQTRFPESREAVLAVLDLQGRWEGDLEHVCKDGRKIIVNSRWALQPNDPPTVLEVNRDVTAERGLQAERDAWAARQEHIANTLQRSLLITPPPDIFPGLTVKALYHPAQDDLLVGGDFFDIYAVGENEVALVIGDATGKGLEAATYTAEIKFALRAFLREYPSPAIALERLNSFVTDKDRLDLAHLGQSYIALAVVMVNTATGSVNASLAGMELPFLIRANGEVVNFGSGGPLLGVVEGARYEAQEDTMQQGDVLIMSTDGLLEARHPDRPTDFFGADRLADAVREAIQVEPTLTGAEDRLLAEVRRFAGGVIRDDVCLLISRRRIHPAGL